MAARPLRTAAAIVVVVAAMLGVWWIDRGDDQVRRIDGPITRVEAPPAIEVAAIADPAERAAVVRVANTNDRGGPYLYPRDGGVFANREGRLPARPPDYWREYTVPTPGSPDRGARRLVAGARHELYYTRDHYGSFTALRGAIP